MIDVMWDWFQGFSPNESGITIENLSPQTSIIALQGPKARRIWMLQWAKDNM